MNAQQASAALRKMKPLRDIALVSPAEWDKRERLIEIVERETQDQDYIANRNRLIPVATRLTGDDATRQYAWAREYLANMDKLWKATQGKPVNYHNVG